jgi:hypothetical protein
MAGFLEDPVGYLFGPGTPYPTYEALQRRRQIAAALASKRSKFPTNVGEGLTYFGEQLGDILAERRLEAAEKKFTEAEEGVLDRSKAPPLASAATDDSVAALPDEPVAAQVRNASLARGDALAAVPTPAPITPQGPAGPAQMLASQPPAQTGPRPGRPVMPTSRNWGDDEAEAAGLHEPRAPTPPLATMADAAPAPQQPLPVPGAPAPVPGTPAGAPAGVPSAQAPDDLRARVAAAVQLQDAGQMGGGATPSPVAPQSNIAYPPTAAAGRAGVVSDAPPVGAAPMGAPAAQGLAGAPDARAGIYNAVAAQNAPPSPVAPPGPRLAQAGGPAPIPAPAPAQVLPTPAQLPRGIPGPLEAMPGPSAVPVGPRRVIPDQPSFNRPVEDPLPPKPTPLTPHELYGQQLLKDRRTFGSPRVQQQAQEYINFGAAQRKFLDERNIKKWEKQIDENVALRKQREDQLFNLAGKDAETRSKELANAAAEDERIRKNYFGDLPATEIIKDVRTSKDAVKGVLPANISIRNALAALDKGMFVGAGASVKGSYDKLWEFLGYKPDPRLSETQKFESFLEIVAANKRQAIAGSSQLTDRDVQAGRKAVAADPNLTPATIRAVLASELDMNRMLAVEHNNKVLAFTGSNPAAQQRLFPVFGFTPKQMVEFLPQEAIAELKAGLASKDPEVRRKTAEAFDEDFATPGLARHVIMGR